MVAISSENSTPIYPNRDMWHTLTHILALNRSTQYIANHDRNGKEEQPATIKQKAMLEKMFYEVHQYLYQDTHSSMQFSENRAGAVNDANTRIRIRNIVHELSEELFDALPKPVDLSNDKLAVVYAKYYIQLRQEEPFAYGNELTISTFLSAVSRIPAEKEIVNTYIDFRRLDPSDLEVFEVGNPKALDFEKIKTAFSQALDKARDTHIPNQRAKANTLKIPGDNKPHPNSLAKDEQPNSETFEAWPDRTVEIAGVPFLGYKDKNDQLFMVTITGGLVPYETAREAIENDIKHNKLIDQLTRFKTETSLKIYEDNEHEIPKEIKLPASGVIDGFKYDENHGAPLVCLDMNLLTGLRAEAHGAFYNAFKEVFKDKEIFLLADEHEKDKFLTSVRGKGDQRLTEICETACKHINYLTDQIDAEIEKVIPKDVAKDNIIPSVENPLLVISMGGSGSGKNVVTEYIDKLTVSSKDKKNYVKASLDDYRNKSILYKVMQAAGHHADDYSLVEPFANTLRKWMTDRALERNKHILYDGSAIPFKGSRYDDLIEKAGKWNYQIDVCAADAYLDIPKEAKTKRMTESAFERVTARYHGKENRCLPWGVVLDKHTNAIKAFLEAAQDSRIRNVMLYNMDGKKGSSYLTAYASTIDKQDLEIKQKLESLDPDVYKTILESKGFTDKDFAKIPYFVPENIGFTLRTDNNNERVLMITDMHKMVQMGEKGLQLSSASGKRAFNHRKETLGGVIPSPTLSFVERVIADVGSTLNKVLNYVKPSDGYRDAVAEKQKPAPQLSV